MINRILQSLLAASYRVSSCAGPKDSKAPGRADRRPLEDPAPVAQFRHALKGTLVPLLLLCFIAPSDPVWAASHPPTIHPDAQAIDSDAMILAKPPPPRFSSFSNLFASKHPKAGWRGVLRRLKERGVTLSITENAEGFCNFLGGKQQGQAGALTTMADAMIHMQRLAGLRGGKAHISLWDHVGRNPSQALVGDSQVFDKLNFRPYFNIYQLWYQQELWNRKLRIQAGKIDANSEFSVNKFGLLFLNSSAQLSAAEFTLPSTPAPMPGIDAFVSPFAGLYAGFGFYHSNKNVGFLNFRGDPESVRSAASGNLYIGESGLKWKHLANIAADGYAKFGYWGHTGTFTRLNGSTQRGAEGFYLLLGQKLGGAEPSSASNRGIHTFFEYSRSNPAIAKVYRHFGAGVTWTGFLAHHPKDVIGFSPEYVSLSPQLHLPHSYELALESFYRIHVTNWCAVEPDLQNILHPGGTNPSALVGSLHVQFSF